MKILNFFRRKATFTPPHPLTLKAMYARDYVRPHYTIPRSYGELMDLHRNVACMFAMKAPCAEDIIYRNAQLEILKRTSFSFYAEQEIAPAVYSRIVQNIKLWSPKSAPRLETVFRRAWRQLSFNFGG